MRAAGGTATVLSGASQGGMARLCPRHVCLSVSDRMAATPHVSLDGREGRGRLRLSRTATPAARVAREGRCPFSIAWHETCSLLQEVYWLWEKPMPDDRCRNIARCIDRRRGAASREAVKTCDKCRRPQGAPHSGATLAKTAPRLVGQCQRLGLTTQPLHTLAM